MPNFVQGALFLDTKTDAHKRPFIRYTLTRVGEAFTFYEHQPYVLVGNTYHARPFTDADTKRALTRVCAKSPEGSGDCPWCNEAYRRSFRFMQNVLVRRTMPCGQRQRKLPSEARLLTGGRKLWEQLQNFSRSSNLILEACWSPEERRTIITLYPNPDRAKWPVTEEDVEQLRQIGEPFLSEYEAWCRENPRLAKKPAHHFYGWQLHTLFLPCETEEAR